MLNAYVNHVEQKSTNQLLKNQVKSMTEKQFRKNILFSCYCSSNYYNKVVACTIHKFTTTRIQSMLKSKNIVIPPLLPDST